MARKKRSKPPEQTIIHVTNPKALEYAPLQDLLHAACEESHSSLTSGEGLIRWVHNMLPERTLDGTPLLGFFVLREELRYKGFVIVQGAWELTPCATVVYFHTDGTRRVRRALVHAAMDWARLHGYTQLLTTRYDKKVREPAMRRLFGDGVRQVKAIGVLYAIEVEDLSKEVTHGLNGR